VEPGAFWKKEASTDPVVRKKYHPLPNSGKEGEEGVGSACRMRERRTEGKRSLFKKEKD